MVFRGVRAPKIILKSIKNVTENALGFLSEILMILGRFWLHFGTILASKNHPKIDAKNDSEKKLILTHLETYLDIEREARIVLASSRTCNNIYI